MLEKLSVGVETKILKTLKFLGGKVWPYGHGVFSCDLPACCVEISTCRGALGDTKAFWVRLWFRYFVFRRSFADLHPEMATGNALLHVYTAKFMELNRGNSRRLTNFLSPKDLSHKFHQLLHVALLLPPSATFGLYKEWVAHGTYVPLCSH